MLMALAAVLTLSVGCTGSKQATEDTPADEAAMAVDEKGTDDTGRVSERDASEPRVLSVAEKKAAAVKADKVMTAKITAAKGALKTIYFEFDKARITPDAAKLLKANRDYLLDNSDIKIVVEGHCDERGTNDYNLALGDRRANAVRRFLSDLRIDPNRMDTITFGENRPVDSASTEAAWAKNRRAEFKPVR